MFEENSHPGDTCRVPASRGCLKSARPSLQKIYVVAPLPAFALFFPRPLSILFPTAFIKHYSAPLATRISGHSTAQQKSWTPSAPIYQPLQHTSSIELWASISIYRILEVPFFPNRNSINCYLSRRLAFADNQCITIFF